ncbi:unnamed protein product, partial [Caenorhabditis brenneri]
KLNRGKILKTSNFSLIVFLALPVNRQIFYILLVLVACFSTAFAAHKGAQDIDKTPVSTPKGAADIFSTLGALITAAALYVL